MVCYKQNSRLTYVPTNNSYFPYFIPIVQFAMDPNGFLMTFKNLVIPKVAENMEVKKVTMNSLPHYPQLHLCCMCHYLLWREIPEKLLKVHGIGVWTPKMALQKKI